MSKVKGEFGLCSCSWGSTFGLCTTVFHFPLLTTNKQTNALKKGFFRINSLFKLSMRDQLDLESFFPHTHTNRHTDRHTHIVHIDSHRRFRRKTSKKRILFKGGIYTCEAGRRPDCYREGILMRRFFFDIWKWKRSLSPHQVRIEMRMVKKGKNFARSLISLSFSFLVNGVDLFLGHRLQLTSTRIMTYRGGQRKNPGWGELRVLFLSRGIFSLFLSTWAERTRVNVKEETISRKIWEKFLLPFLSETLSWWSS